MYTYTYIYIYVSKIITIRSLYCTAKKKLKPKASKKVLFVFHHFISAILSKKCALFCFLDVTTKGQHELQTKHSLKSVGFLVFPRFRL